MNNMPTSVSMIYLFISIFLLIFIALSLSGCSTTEDKKILIPIYSKPKQVEIPLKPYLPIYSLQKGDKADVVIKSYVASVKALNSYIDDSLIPLIKGYQ